MRVESLTSVAAIAVLALSVSAARLVRAEEGKDAKKDDRAPAAGPTDQAPQADRIEPDRKSVEPADRPAGDAVGPSAGESLLRRAERAHARQRERQTLERDRRPLRDPLRGRAPILGGPDDGYYYYHPYYPWYRLPPTAWVKDYPPSITHVPRGGLQHNYPFAYSMGIRVPEDSDPLDVAPNLGPFVGIVGAAKREIAAGEDAEKDASGATDDAATELFKGGRYKEAGRILAERFQVSGDPSDALLLCEVFFALGKPAHAEMLLRHALDSEGVGAALPEDVSRHFPSSEEFEKKLQDLDSGGEHRLLLGYLRVHSRDPDTGLQALQTLVKENPKDKGLARLYRHYLGKAFK